MSQIDISPLQARHAEGTAFTLSALAAVFWGTNFEATRILLQEAPPWTSAAGRFVIASAAIVLWLSLTRGIDRTVLRRNAVAFVTLGIIGVAGFNAALFVGMQSSSPVTAALIMGTSPVTTNLLDALLEHRLPKPIAVIGMGIGLLGVALTVGAFTGTRFAPGDLMILVGSLAWAIYTIGCRRWVRDSSPLETSAWTMLFGALGLVLAAGAMENPVAVMTSASITAWTATLWMALVGSVLAYIFWQIGIRQRGPAATSILFNLVPVSALVVAALFGRIPEWPQVLGVAVAIFGVFLASGRISFGKR